MRQNGVGYLRSRQEASTVGTRKGDHFRGVVRRLKCAEALVAPCPPAFTLYHGYNKVTTSEK